MRLRFVALAVALGARASAATQAQLSVPLGLVEPAGVERRAWPATASVPLPRGRLSTPDVWLEAPSGGATVAQSTVLERWPDGSVRWLLLDFLADVPRGGRATYTLHDGKPPDGPVARVRLERRKDGAQLVDTGTLRAT
ncbi:MAG TPA: hypothetical protein VKA21_10195, partial [Candidatus Binatia bacterium]|nr:hypothetical protein [Candidatus Binatia bacterium]